MTAASYLTPLRTEKIGPQRWILIDNLVFFSELYKGKFIAPRGFQTDFASIPQIFQHIFSKVGSWDKPAVIHDAGYGNALITERGDRIFCIKKVTDNLFREGLEAEGVSLIHRNLMHRAVILGGRPLGHPLAMNKVSIHNGI